MTRQLVGNNDEVTDVCFVGAPAAPTHLAVATNAPDIRLFDIATLGASHRTLPCHHDMCLSSVTSTCGVCRQSLIG